MNKPPQVLKLPDSFLKTFKKFDSMKNYEIYLNANIFLGVQYQ